MNSFLAQEGDLSLTDLAAVLRVDQRERLDRGVFISAETYLTRYPEFERDREAAVDLIYGEFLLREEYGEEPDPSEYLRRFPQHADVLGPQIELHLAMKASAQSGASGFGSAVDRSQFNSLLTTGDSVLEVLQDTLGPVRRIHLKEGEADTVSTKAAPFETVGRLELLGEVARGGMGIVLRGRDRDLGRELAVKVLRDSHRLNPEIARRFVEEAQIGGQLQHPGIVPVYEMGVLADRRPYFSMQLVRGRTLAELLAERDAALEDLPRFLDIFERVAQTVAYAHSRGVIHRDLKPANIMVGRFGEVQVMDWGLAKVLSTDDHDDAGVHLKSNHRPTGHASQAGFLMGTPAYMAPEQARGEFRSVDARVDVFALGGLLCEILTGRPPYQGRSTAGILEEAADRAAASAIERIAALDIDSELKTLASRFLAADPSDRPKDAADVAQAMTDYLASVQRKLRAAELARVDAQARAEEEKKRRRAELRLAAGVLLVLAAGSVGVATQWRRAEVNLEAANSANSQLAVAVASEGNARAQAEERLDLAMAAIERYYTGVSEELHLREPGLETLRGRLLAAALEFYKNLQVQLEAQPDAALRPELAEAYEKIADVNSKSGKLAAVIEPLSRALAIRERLVDARPTEPDIVAAAARDQLRLGTFQDLLGRHDEGLKILEAARVRLERLTREHRESAAFAANHAETLNGLAIVLEHLGRFDDATRTLTQARDIFERVCRDFPGEPKYREGQARLLHNLGIRLEARGQIDDALDSLKRSVAAFEQVAKERPENSSDRSFVGLALIGYGIALEHQQRGSIDALRAIERAESVFVSLVNEYPNIPWLRDHLARARGALGTNHAGAGRWEAAIEAYRRELPLLEQVIRDQPDMPDNQFDLAQCRLNIGGALRRSRHPGEAVAEIREGLAILEPLARKYPRVEAYRQESAKAHINLGALDVSLGALADARTAYSAAAADFESLAEPSFADSYNLACAHARLMILDPAEKLIHQNRALSVLKRATQAGYPDVDTLKGDSDLEPLRRLPEFAAVLLDLMMPADPFSR